MSVFGFGDLAFVGAVTAGYAPTDPDAAAYITAVEAADGQPLESVVRRVIDEFVIGCKADGIWTAIKASCILAAARTLAGALVPLVGAAPTRFGTEGGWSYNRKTGLKGNGTDNYLSSNRANNADPQDSNHNAVFITSTTTITSSAYMGATGGPSDTGTNVLLNNLTRSRSGTSSNVAGTAAAGLYGINRSLSASYTVRNNSTNYTASVVSQLAENANIFVYQRGSVGFEARSNARLAFYSIGEALDLALLDARVTALINAIAAAIP